MNPGKTYLPLASITSAPAGAGRLRPIAAIVSPSHRMSATYWSVAVVIWPFLMSSDMQCLKGKITFKWQSGDSFGYTAAPRSIPSLAQTSVRPVLPRLALLFRALEYRIKSCWIGANVWPSKDYQAR